MMKKLILSIAIIPIIFGGTFAQSDTVKTKVTGTFASLKTINLQTVETLNKRTLGYNISHRFGDLADPIDQFFGMDGSANITFNLNYGVTDNLMLGVGRNSFNKVYEGYAKYNILQQEDNGMPLTLGVYGKANIISGEDQAAAATGFDRYANFENRMFYITQILVARKISEGISVQLAPTFIHHNLVEFDADANSIMAVAASGRVKITKNMSVTGEYAYVLNDHAVNDSVYHNSFGIGLDYETGGHVFQITVNNSSMINDAQAIPYTTKDWFNGNGEFRLGFNITRNFKL